MIDFADLTVRVNYTDADKATASLDKLSQAGQKAEQSTNRLGATSVSATRNMGAWAAIQAEAEGNVGQHSLAINRLERNMSSVTEKALGLNSTLGLLGATSLKFGVGDIYTLAIVGGLAAISFAYEAFTEDSRKATEQIDKMTKSLLEQARAAREATVAGREDLKLIAETNQQTVNKESGLGWRSIVGSLLSGHLSINGADAAAQAGRRADAQSGVDQATANWTKTWKKDNDDRIQKAEEAARKIDAAFQKEIDTLTKGLVFTDQRKRVTAELVGIEHQLEAQVNNGTLSLEKRTIALERLAKVQDALGQKFIVPPNITNPGQLVGITGDGATPAARFDAAYGGAMQNVLEKVATSGFTHRADQPDLIAAQQARDEKNLTEAEKNAKKLSDAIWGAAQASANVIVSALNIGGGGRGSGIGGALGQAGGGAAGYLLGAAGGTLGFLGGPAGAIVGATVGGILGSAIGGLFDHGKAVREAAKAQRNINLELDQIAAGLSHNKLASALLAIEANLASTIASFNAALPGTRNEGQRNADIAQAKVYAEQQKQQATAQIAADNKYASEDLTVRNLKALGHTDEANLVAFKEAQQRELAQAILDGRDATYQNTLVQTQANELLAFNNGLLSTALRNAPTGFYGAAAYIGAYATPRTADPFNTGMVPPNSPVNPTGGLTPPGGSNGRPPINLTAIFTLDGKVVTQVVVKNLDQTAAATGGAGSSRSQALDLYN